ncbi:helix-turn-helix domain-containing protein [Streptomyces acidiscabies]|uniref:helix-turn-helix domain-containing protein n=1 Tax=Streptomyces acidiscabies TaxID=42234 RepID=UPI001F3B5CB6|nr:AraC family transcriptional regulator [Streptomyces acidiscabies]
MGLEYEQSGPADGLYAQSLVQAVAAHVVKVASAHGNAARPAGPGLAPRRLAQVTDYIHANLAEPLSLDTLARVAGISSSHFTRTFRASTGHSPHQYVLRQRLEQARTVLLTTASPIADIALACGFTDQSHLTRTMRRQLGVTPHALRAG